MGDLQDVIENVKATVKMEDVIDMVGLGPIGRGRKIHSLTGSDKTPSLHLYDYDWYDFSTGQGGSQIDFVMTALDCTFSKALHILSRGASDSIHARRPEKHVTKDKPNMNDEFLKQITGETSLLNMAFFAKRWDYLDQYDIEMSGSAVVKGWSLAGGELWTPHHSQDWTRITGIKRRFDDGSKVAVPGSSFTESLYRPRMKDTARAIIVEGESDAWCMNKWVTKHAPDWTVYGMPAGAGCWRPEFMNQLANLEQLRIILDQDKPGLEAEQAIWMSLEDKVADIDKVAPEGGRVAEALAAGWVPWTS